MADIDAKTVMQLRKQTGAPMMDCKAALVEAGGDMELAVDVLRKKGLKTADAKAGREATEGRIFSYVHGPGRIGVLAEIGCETDFVARNDEFEQFGRDLCMHIAFANPLGLTREDVDPAIVAKEREIEGARAREQMKGKPADVIQKAIDGRIDRFFAERCLLDQPWVKDEKKTVEQVRRELVARIGENLQIRRFARFELGG